MIMTKVIIIFLKFKGFTEVKQKRTPTVKVSVVVAASTDEKKENTHLKPKVFHHGTKPNTRSGKREFDRHESGTGRGKEISKNGAGGKGVWGSDSMVAKEETETFYAKKAARNYDNDDYCKSLKINSLF